MTGAGHDAEVWSVQRLLTWTQNYFQQQGLEAPRLCAEILLAHAMNTERLRLYTCFNDTPDEATRTRFRALVRAAATGQPIAYLTGTKEFFSLAFEVDPAVLIPRPETETLVERTVSLVRKSSETLKRILDVGTGSGCIAVSLARHLPDVDVFASDVSEDAVAVAQRNAARHGCGGRIEFRTGDLLAPWADETFDIIVANPPYVAREGAPVDDAVRTFEPAAAVFAGPDGLDVIRRLIADARGHLRGDGHFLMEMAFDQADAVRALLDDATWQDVVTYRDGGGHERIVHARRRADEQAQVA